MTMCHVKSLFWIPYLRRLSKSVIRNCYRCKKFRNLPFHSPKPGPLPKDRTEKCFPFEVIKPQRKVNSKHISYYFLVE